MHSMEPQMSDHDERKTGGPEPEPVKPVEEPTNGMQTMGDGSLGPDDPIQEGEVPGAGTYACVKCSQQVVIGSGEPLPSCPSCGATYDPSFYTPYP